MLSEILQNAEALFKILEIFGDVWDFDNAYHQNTDDILMICFIKIEAVSDAEFTIKGDFLARILQAHPDRKAEHV